MLSINFSQVIKALSDTLDLVGVDDFQHGKRVAFMALEMARLLGWSAADELTIYHAGFLHDCGVSTTREHHHLIAEIDWKHSQDHSIRGCKLLEEQPFLRPLAPIIRYHHTHWDELKQIELDPQIALMANLIFLSDRIDALMVRHRSHGDILLYRYTIREKIEGFSERLFAPQLIEVFLEISNSEFFWLTLEERHLNLYLQTENHTPNQLEMSPDSFLQIAKLFARIVDAKSPFTARHSLGVSQLCHYLGILDGMSSSQCYLLEIAGLLHDLGKLNVPDEILEKAGPLNESEQAIMMRHSFESFQILRQIQGLEEVAKWAAFHHESLSGEGYPYRLEQSRLSREARIVAVADVFQALSQRRPYRDALPPEKSLSILKQMGETHKLDKDIIALIETNLNSCWEKAMAHERP